MTVDASTLPRIDLVRLALNLGGNKATVIEMLHMFLTTAQKTIEEMEEAERKGNLLTWLQGAHHLKGAAKNITAKRLAQLCSEAEAIDCLPHAHTQNVLYNMSKELAHLRQLFAANFPTA